MIGIFPFLVLLPWKLHANLDHGNRMQLYVNYYSNDIDFKFCQ